MTIKSELTKLKTTDLFSLLLFALYKIKDVDEYSTISELAFVLDKENLLNLCEYFGGITLKIPTIDELESVINSLLVYQYVNIDGYDYKDAIKEIGFDSSQLRQVKKDYNKIVEILKDYSFTK
jgi:hydrogenase maturation factor HypE